jgi:uncharacterized protein YlbG (UPF0298 family)
MEKTKYSVLFVKMQEVGCQMEREGHVRVVKASDEPAELEEIRELMRIVSDISEPTSQSYTTT